MCIYQAVKAVLGTMIFLFVFMTGVVYAVDIDVARQDYESAVRKGTSGAIKGCIFKSNCERYTELLNSLD